MGLAFTATARRRQLGPGQLRVLPSLDRAAIEAPVTADAKTRQTTLPQEPVDRSRMHPQVVGQFLDGEKYRPGKPGCGRNHLDRASIASLRPVATYCYITTSSANASESRNN